MKIVLWKLGAAGAASWTLVLSGCQAPSRPIQLESKLEGDLRGDLQASMEGALSLEGALRLEGPIMIQMQGPSVRYQGAFVSEALFDLVKPGTTSGAWVLAAFGEPDRVSPAPEGGEYWVWAYRLGSVEGSFVELLQFGGGDEDKAPANATVIVRVAGGVVAEKWRG